MADSCFKFLHVNPLYDGDEIPAFLKEKKIALSRTHSKAFNNQHIESDYNQLKALTALNYFTTLLRGARQNLSDLLTASPKIKLTKKKKI